MTSSDVPGRPSGWRAFSALAIGTVMATLDISVVNVALPTLSRSFHAPLLEVEWVVLAYVTTITSLLLLLGRIADRSGRRRMYLGGLAAFAAASAGCAAAPSVWWLVAARILQGIGAAMMTANTAALLIPAFPPEQRGRVLGLFGAAVGVGLAVGPPLGGLIVGVASWRWIFLLNLPLGLAGLILVRRFVPADRPEERDAPVDAPGAALAAGALAALLVALARGPETGWNAAPVLGAFSAATLLGTLFVVRERGARGPLIPRELLGPEFLRAATLTLFGQGLSMAVGLQLPLYLENVLGWGPARVGRWLAIMPLAAMLLAPLAGRAADRMGPRPLVVGGLVLSAAGLAVLGALSGGMQPALLVSGLALIGVGFGIFAIPNASALFGAARPGRLGAASGIQGTMRNLGFTAGSALTAAFLASRFRAHGGGVLAAGFVDEQARRALVLASREFYWAGAGLALLGAGIAAAGPPSQSPTPIADTQA